MDLRAPNADRRAPTGVSTHSTTTGFTRTPRYRVSVLGGSSSAGTNPALLETPTPSTPATGPDRKPRAEREEQLLRCAGGGDEALCVTGYRDGHLVRHAGGEASGRGVSSVDRS